jgi:hypothetical protein
MLFQQGHLSSSTSDVPFSEPNLAGPTASVHSGDQP